MRINIQHTPAKQTILKSRNIPIYKNSFSIKNSIAAIEYEKNFISEEAQFKQLAQVLNTCTDNPYLYGIAGEFDTSKAKVIASLICLKYFDKANVELSTDNIPYWHTVFGGLPDRLRDKDTNIRTSLLVLDNIVANSTDNKLEKVRDLVERYSAIPRIIVMGGTNPLKYSREKLYLKFDKMLYIGNNKVIQL